MKILTGTEISILREILGMSRADLGKLTFLSRQQIANIEEDKVKTKSSYLLLTYAIRDVFEEKYPDKNFDEFLKESSPYINEIQGLTDKIHALYGKMKLD